MEWLPLHSEMNVKVVRRREPREPRGPANRIRHFTYSDGVLDNASGGVICNNRFMPPAGGARFDLGKSKIQSIIDNATRADTADLSIAVGYRAGWRNYYHWTTQCLLNTYWLHREGLLEGSVLALPKLGGLQERSLQLLGITPEKLYLDNAGSLRARNFKVTNVLFASTADRFPAELRSMASTLKSAARMEEPEGSQWIYISRLDSHRRKMSNEESLIQALEKFGIAHVSMTGKTLDEQMAVVAAARLIVAPHGAALTNILYSESGAHLYELFSSSYVSRCYQALARASGMGYSDDVFASSTGERHNTVWSVDVDQVCRKTEALLTHLSAKSKRNAAPSRSQLRDRG